MGIEQKVDKVNLDLVKQEIKKHPIRIIRLAVEPLYSIRVALKTFPRGNPHRRTLVKDAIFIESIKLGALAYAAYLTYQAFN